MRTTILFVLLCAVALTAFAGNGLTLDQARKRALALRTEIAHHDELYFGQASPEITDAQYDALKQELRAIQERFPDLAATLGVGDDHVTGFSSHRHRVRMLSLNKSHTEAELKVFITKLNRQLGREDLIFVIEPKYDGLAISVTYENGQLVRAVTRGDGIKGDDVTDRLLALCALPRQLAGKGSQLPALIELRGEVYMTHAEFSRINREREAAGEEPFAHPRNLAVGTLKQEPRSGDSHRRLEVAFYGLGAVLPVSATPFSQQALHAQIRAWGLPGVSEFQSVRSATQAWQAIQALGSRRSELPYPIDGAVVKLNDLRLQDDLGATEEAPRGAIAYKFPPGTFSTRLTSITLQIGRTGLVSPVAELEPVKIAGSTIRRASLHNRDEIARKDIRIGDYVMLEKAGEIIPVITGIDPSRRAANASPYVFPENCQVCRTALAVDGPRVLCPNYECLAQIQRRLEHFGSNGAMDIDGLGKTLIESLTQSGLVRTPADLYALTREQLAAVATPKSADKVLAAIAGSKHRELWRLVHGLGVPGVGTTGAKAIAQRFQGLAAWANARAGEYAGSGISGATMSASLAFFAEEGRREDAKALQRATSPD